MNPTSITHVHSITSKIGFLVTGLTADCHAQVWCAGYKANDFQFKYGYDIPVNVLAKHIVDIVQVYTQSASMQLLATVCLLIGVDDEQGLQVFKVDCVGHYLPFYAAASSAKMQEEVNFLEKKANDIKGYDLDQTVRAAIMCIGTVLGSDFIMVMGGNCALGQAVIQPAAICTVEGIYVPVWKENACVTTELYVE
eukprot:12753249-Ditylum_brightwellii.AAC.1